MTIKQVIGAVLVATPFIVVAAFGIAIIGFGATGIVFGLTALIVAFLYFGLCLLIVRRT